MKINNILLRKVIKRSILNYLILCLLVSLSTALQAAASAPQSNTLESYDYTLQNHADQVSPIEEEAYLDIEEMPKDLATIVNAIPTPTEEPDAHRPQLLAVVTYHPITRYYCKYLFASNGLLVGSLAQQKAHKLNYHLIKAPKGPVIWQVLSFLDQRSDLEIKALMLPKDTPLCLPCAHMCMHLFDKKPPMHKAGCQGQPFPTTAAPVSAIACFYSQRFTGQQRRLVMNQIGDKAFPDPKKRIASPPTHHNDHHRLTSQQLTQALPADQLLVPANGHCLYTTIIIGYLLPVKQASDKLTARVDQLFGLQPAYYLNKLHQTLQNPTHYLAYLHSDPFSTLVAAFMTRMQIKKGTWGGPQEIQIIANKLKVNIQEYYPDPSDRTLLVPSDLTKPAKAIADITLHIVRDKVHSTEVLTQAERDSVVDNPHHQHYRLKYTFPPNIAPYTNNAYNHESKSPAIGNHHKDRSLPYGSFFLAQSTQSLIHSGDERAEEESSTSQKKSTAQAAAKATSPLSPSANHMDTPTRPLKQALPLGQLLIPANGQCLYTTIIMGYLLPAKEAADEVNTRIDQLFGMQPAYDLNELHQTLENPTHYLTYLHSDAFSTLVAAFMTRMQIKKGTWGGPQEMQTIANKLKVNIQAYYPDPSNPANLVQSDLTKSAQANATITLHIVRDKVHPAEVLTQAEKASAKDNPHYQHYRLKYTLPSPLSHKMGSQHKSFIRPYLVEWCKAAKTGNRKLLEELYNKYNINVNHKDEDHYTALLWSALSGYLDCVKYLVQQGADVHIKNENGRTALIQSAQHGHLDCVKYLHQQGARINARDKWENTALLLSAGFGHLDCIKFLHQQGAHINATNKWKNTALIWSAQNGHLDCVKYLLQQGAHINATNKYGSTPLPLSASEGHLDCVKYLLLQDVHIHDKNKRKNTSLLLSARGGYLDCVKFLVQQGTHINTRNADGYTALLLSAQEGYLDCVKYLVQQGADINTSAKNRYTALLLSAYRGHLACVKYLVQKGANIRTRARDGYTALLLSARLGHVGAVNYLLQKGADINEKNKHGNTALLLSTKKGHLYCLKWLTQQGADLNASDKNGGTALIQGAQEGHLGCVKYLVQKGVDINIKDKYGDTALLLSARGGYLDCVKFLIQQGAHINSKDRYGDTALLLSARLGYLDCVKCLLQQGANVTLKGQDGKTALECAKKAGQHDVVSYLSAATNALQKWFGAAEKGDKKLLETLCNSYINCRDKNSNTALLWSAQKGHLTCLKYLHQQGAHIHHQNKWGNTALLLSARYGHLDCVKYLHKQGADINTKDNCGDTALLWSAKKGHLDCLQYLHQQGADIHHQNKREDTALLLSAHKGRLDCLKFLHEQGADINTKDKCGDTALLLSARKGHVGCVKYLVQQGANVTLKGKDSKTALEWAKKTGKHDVVNFLSTFVKK